MQQAQQQFASLALHFHPLEELSKTSSAWNISPKDWFSGSYVIDSNEQQELRTTMREGNTNYIQETNTNTYVLTFLTKTLKWWFSREGVGGAHCLDEERTSSVYSHCPSSPPHFFSPSVKADHMNWAILVTPTWNSWEAMREKNSGPKTLLQKCNSLHTWLLKLRAVIWNPFHQIVAKMICCNFMTNFIYCHHSLIKTCSSLEPY